MKEHSNIESDHVSISVQIIKPDGAKAWPFLVFLHHALGSIGQWKDFPERLAAKTGLPAVIIERPGHGLSGDPAGPRGLHFFHEEALDRLPGILRQLGIERPILIGHSDGASIGLLYATRFPATAVIAEAPHILVEPRIVEGIGKALEDKDHLIEKLRRYHGYRTEALVNAWSGLWLAPLFRDWSIEPELPAIKCPVLVIQGASDPYGALRHAQGIQAALGTKAELLLLEGGHFLHAEAGEIVLENMTAFVRRTLENNSIHIP